jgi:hypothetical protein
VDGSDVTVEFAPGPKVRRGGTIDLRFGGARSFRVTPAELAEIVRLAPKALAAARVAATTKALGRAAAGFAVHPPASEPVPAFEVGDPRQ